MIIVDLADHARISCLGLLVGKAFVLDALLLLKLKTLILVNRQL
jgi:hypothetical protein